MVYITYIMQRTQIYIDPGQAALLDKRAKASSTTRSALIRTAIEQYLERDVGEIRLGQFRAELDRSFGIAPYIPADYVDRLRANDRHRQEDLGERWRG